MSQGQIPVEPDLQMDSSSRGVEVRKTAPSGDWSKKTGPQRKTVQMKDVAQDFTEHDAFFEDAEGSSEADGDSDS